jgi:hypothetical protein
MAAAPRDHRRKDWPRGLREPRPGYFVWRHPDGTDMPIGRVTLTRAKQEAIGANEYVTAQSPTLLERLNGSGNTVAQLLDAMPVAPNSNTAKSWRSLDKKIRAAIGKKLCAGVTVKDCADMIEAELEAEHERTAEALRSRLISVCAKGMAKGWMDSNPAEATEKPKVTVNRARLTLEWFNAILEVAPKVKEWLPGAMLVAITTGLDRSTVAGLRLPAIEGDLARADGYLVAERGKTGVVIEIPLGLRLDSIGKSVADALLACRSKVRSTRVGCDFIVHHRQEFGNAPLGGGVHPDNFSESFTEARRLAGIPDVLPDGKDAPTFHEIRSLCKRLYMKQGGVDTKALLGHKTEKMGDLYANPRGSERIRVRIG